MKYLIKIMLLSISVIPFLTWELLVGIWLFRFEDLKTLWNDYSDTIESNYRRAFPRKSKKSRFNLQKSL